MSDQSIYITYPISKRFYIPFYWKVNTCYEELHDYFKNIYSSQVTIQSFYKNHQKQILSLRRKVVQWIFHVSKNLNLKNETVFKTIQLFDQYLSNAGRSKSCSDNFSNPEDQGNLIQTLHFISAVCLNLACKLKEINCNYLQFFNNNLFDKNSHYTHKDFVEKEKEILKVLKYKLDTPNFYDFNTALLQIAISEFSKKAQNEINYDMSFFIAQLINSNEYITKYFMDFKESAFISPLNSGLICFKATILAFSYMMGVDMSSVNMVIDGHIKFLNFEQSLLEENNNFSYNVFSYILKQKKLCFVNTNNIMLLEDLESF